MLGRQPVARKVPVTAGATALVVAGAATAVSGIVARPQATSRRRRAALTSLESCGVHFS